jgi:DNA-binding XRE family transcriptional regulator
MNCLWYEDITQEELANVLELAPETLYRKIFQDDDFTPGEIKKIVSLLGLTEEETNTIFYS